MPAQFLKEHPDVTAHIDKAVRQALGLSKAADGEAAAAAGSPHGSARAFAMARGSLQEVKKRRPAPRGRPDRSNMQSYDSNQFPGEGDWASRFPPDAIGSEELRGIPFSLEGNLAAWQRLTAIRVPLDRGKYSDPRVFVSHRRIDRNQALRAAELATQEGFYFWLDVLNPQLQGLAYQKMPDRQRALATAIIIEMGLLNCSHVLVILTPDTAGSLWVPYEYGRCERRCGCSRPRQAVGIIPTSPPGRGEYLDLGVDTYNEPQISGWLDREITIWSQSTGRPRAHAATLALPARSRQVVISPRRSA